MDSEHPHQPEQPENAMRGEVSQEPQDNYRPMLVQLPLAPRILVTYLLLAAIAVVFVLETIAGGDLNGSQSLDVLEEFGALNTADVYNGEYWRMFTSMFIHIGILHILFNGYALYVLGREAERLYGSLRYAIIYVLSGLFGSLLTLATSDPRTLSAGASGAIFGLLGSLAIFYYIQRKTLGQMARANLNQLLFFMVINLIFGFTTPGIGNAAHIGGLLGGIGLTWFMGPRFAPAQIQRIAEPYPSVFGYQSAPQVIQMVDTNPLRRTWWVAIIAALLIVIGTYAVGELRGYQVTAQLLISEGRQAENAGNVREAEADYRRAIALDPSLMIARVALAVLLDDGQRAAEAETTLDEAARLSATNADNTWIVALGYINTGNHPRAKQSFEHYLQLAPIGRYAGQARNYLDALGK